MRSAVAGFFEQFAPSGFGDGFAEEFGFVADDASGQFDDAPLERDAELFNEDDFVLGGDGEDADASVCLRAADKIPVADAVKAEPAGFEKGLGAWHGMNWGKKRWHMSRKKATAAAR